MSYIIWFLSFIGLFSLLTVTVDGYSRECDVNQTKFTPEGSTVTFVNNITITGGLFRMRKTSGSATGFRVYLYLAGTNGTLTIANIYAFPGAWENKTSISIQFHSDSKPYVRIILSNVSMEDNGTYRIIYGRDYACYILYVMEIKAEPSLSREENDPIYVFAHPQYSLIKRPLTNATMVWLLDGKSVNQSARFIQQDGLIWIPRIRRGLNGRNVTYRALHDDGRITDVNTTVTVKYGPSHPLTLVPKKTHYNMVSGDTMPDITCTSECNPPCNISWGEHSERETLSLGTVKKEDSGEYTCTASRIGGQTIQQTVSIFVADRPLQSLILSPRKTFYNLVSGDAMPDITCTSECYPPCTISWGEHSKDNILSLGAVTTDDTGEYTCTARRVDGRSVEQTVSVFVSVSECVSKNKTDNTTVTFSQSNVQGSKKRMYEDLRHGTRNNVYGEVNLSIIGDDATVSTYENTSIKS
ncbi:hemicentin-2-like isoform X2 [Ruditapes philippinarum]|uniref:hemicentin-2-like isoform X2 n=1 Tax=Ruditapes philippinarum TaxID=129788 RepID=UPI00295B4172|nr:hemicentin-2-like isoform X2 [Ruditapes philippinarum]